MTAHHVFRLAGRDQFQGQCLNVSISDLCHAIVGAGFLLVKPVPRPDWLSRDLLPDRIISASSCICPQFPRSYAIRWCRDSDEARTEAFDAIGLVAEKREEAMDWATEEFEKAFGWPGVFLTLGAARKARAQFFADSDLVVIGVGLPEQHCAAFVSHATPAPPEPGFAPVGKSGALSVVEAARPLPPPAAILGYEPLNVENGQIDHSWLCNHLEEHVAKDLGIRPGSTGLLQSLADASRCCESIEHGEIGAEPGPWFPWLLAQYHDTA